MLVDCSPIFNYLSKHIRQWIRDEVIITDLTNALLQYLVNITIQKQTFIFRKVVHRRVWSATGSLKINLLEY